jgi:nitrous oxidase accessory protein NosD
MRRTILLMVTMALTLLVASGVELAATIGSAGAQSSVVGPGESIQKAINAADPGDTIVVRGVHREDVIITKNGIKLRGEDAVIEAPARAGSPCSKFIGLEAICVLGDFNPENGEITGPRVRDVSISGFTIRGFKDKDALAVIDVYAARNFTVAGNRITGNVANGIVTGRLVDSTIANNHVIGGPDTAEHGILVDNFSSNTKIVNNVVRSYASGIEADKTTDTAIEGNDSIGNGFGVFDIESTGTKIVSNDIPDSTSIGTIIVDSTGTKILSNDIRRSGERGISIFGPARANTDAKVVGNRISGSAFGILVANAHGGSFTGNRVHDNCAGMFFEAFKGEPVGGFEVTGNTVEKNTRSCRAAQFEINISGVGIALLGASGMELTGNQISGNVPSGPTRISGGVVVSTNPYGRSGTPKPRNNSVTGNHFGRNKPDIFYDKSGSGNRFVGNLCDTSVPSSLCN